MPLKNRRSMLLATILITAFLSQFATADLVRSEAEYGLLGGPDVAVSTSATGYSGTGYVTGFIKSAEDPNDEMVTVAVYANSAGNYPLTIGYRSPYSDKQNQILINGVLDSKPDFPLSTSFTELSYGNISLVAGTNTISFASWEGWMDVDYFDVGSLDRQATDPDPAYKATVSAGITQLCWTKPDPGPGDIITCDVYLGTTVPDGSADYGLTKIASGIWENCIEIPIELLTFETYYWVVDCWDYNSGSPILLRGPSWEFTTVRRPTVLEAENSWYSDQGGGATTESSIAGYSGSGYKVLRAGNGTPALADRVTVSVFSDSAGSYPLSIRYNLPPSWNAKKQYIYVNDVQQTSPLFPTTIDWDIFEYGDISLNEGMNTIAIGSWYGYMYVDYFAIEGLNRSATNPIPAHLDTVAASQAQVCWTNPAPNSPSDTITADVYFGTDPNGIFLSQIATGTTDTCVDIPGGVAMGHDYYWRVNCWDPDGGGTPISLPGGLWTFSAGNAPPDPNAGPDQYTWLGKDGTPGQITVNINARVTDDGYPSGTLTYLWEQIANEAPTVVISPDDVKDISITFTEAGFYGFRLTASDGELEGTDSVYIGIGTNPCDAVQQNPYWWSYQGDINEDCTVDLKDFGLLAIDWLNCLDPAGCQ